MSFRDVIRRNRQGTVIVPHHDHEASDISGTFGFLRALQALIDGSVTITDTLTVSEGGSIIVAGGGSLIVGDPSGTSQLQVHNTLEHLGFFETDGTNYPDDVLVYDINGDIGRIFFYAPFPTAVRLLEFWMDGSVDLANGAKLMASGEPAYLLKERVIFTASGTFDKDDYPGIRAVRVSMIGGGGAGGGAEITAAGEISMGGGGGGGAYVESWILEADLDAAGEAVTVGAAGTGASGANGGNGGDSIFDTISGEVRADQGVGGSVGTAAAVGTAFGNRGTGGLASGSTGDVEFGGGDGGNGFGTSVTRVHGGFGGPGAGSWGGGTSNNAVTGGGVAGASGNQWGGGGSGGANAQSQGTARAGGDGAQGIVVVDVYA